MAKKPTSARMSYLRRGDAWPGNDKAPENDQERAARLAETQARRKAGANAHKAIVRAILQYCWLRRWYAWESDSEKVKNPFNGRAQTKNPSGHPDISGVCKPTGRAFFIEVKGGAYSDPRPNQRDKHAQLIEAGAAVYVARSSQEAIEFLRLLGEGEAQKHTLMKGSNPDA
jgi:hypothetical protein